jgi:predicted TIM-barrel fold metal-dependent hydrolase
LPTPDWLDESMAGYVEAAEAYFRSPAQRESLAELAERYEQLDVLAVLLAWDAETSTGRPRVPNETVAAACRDYPRAFTGFGSVDPHKGGAVDEIAKIRELGLRGVKFHPSLQAFDPSDPKYWPVFAACERHDLIALFHTGTSGIGARRPGGQGIRIDLAHPLKLDPVAAAHPDLTIVAAHFGWPWHMDLIAIALHKTNVYIDISGWAPKRIPAEVISELRGRLSGQFMWGSDFPFFTPDRCLAGVDELGLPSDVTRAILHDNAARILRVLLPGRLRVVAETAEEAPEQTAVPGQRLAGRRRHGALMPLGLVVIGPGDGVHDLVLGEAIGIGDLRDETDQVTVQQDLGLESAGALRAPDRHPAAGQRDLDAIRVNAGIHHVGVDASFPERIRHSPCPVLIHAVRVSAKA